VRIVVTGGRGFIGSHFVELALDRGHRIVDIDKLTYCSNKRLPFDSNPGYEHVNADICDVVHIPFCDAVVNFAAETHVDNSIVSSVEFVRSNVLGVRNLLDLIRGRVYERPLFLQVSTDEVYGDAVSTFTETDSLRPSNPYAATKAAAEHLVTAYARTYGVSYLITRSSNNYGPRQYEEKLIPKIISCLRESRKIPLHGTGLYVRDWIYVKDNVRVIMELLERAVAGEISNDVFNVAGQLSLTNREVVKQVCGWFSVCDWESRVVTTDNRLGQDERYSISNSKIESTGISVPRRTELFRWMSK